MALGKDFRSIFRNLIKGDFEHISIALHQKYSDLISSYNYTPVWEKDWDVLLVIDGCRYDYAKQVFKEDRYNVEKTGAPGSSSKDWAQHFREADSLENIVYMSANPHISNQKIEQFAGKNPFFMIFDVWKTDWDQEKQTVMPDKINQKFLNVKDTYSDKKFILHYMQPHHPFVGEIELKDVNTRQLPSDTEESVDREQMVWKRYKRGEIEHEKFEKAYISNIEFVKSQLEKIIPETDGKVVITSDHGNMFGKRGIYGHPPNLTLDELVEVPWIEVLED